MTYYVGIHSGKVVGNWGGLVELNEAAQTVACGIKPERVEKVGSSSAVVLGKRLVCYKADWTLKTQAELASEGFAIDGTKLPTQAEIDAEKKRQADLKTAKDRKAVLVKAIEDSCVKELASIEYIAAHKARGEAMANIGALTAVNADYEAKKALYLSQLKNEPTNKTLLEGKKAQKVKDQAELVTVEAQIKVLEGQKNA